MIFFFAKLKLVKSTLKLEQSTLKLEKSTLNLAKSTLEFEKSTLKLIVLMRHVSQNLSLFDVCIYPSNY